MGWCGSVFLDLWYKGSAKEILIEKLKLSPKNLRGLDLEIEKVKKRWRK